MKQDAGTLIARWMLLAVASVIAFVVAFVVTSQAPGVLLSALADPKPSRPLVLVHGTVRDYAGRLVAKALVSFGGTGKSMQTDQQGQFTARVPARTFVSASKHDMLGHVVLGDAPDQTVTIRMDQMPM